MSASCLFYLYCFFFFRRAAWSASWIKKNIKKTISIPKFFFLLFSLLLVLACGFSLVRFFINSFRSVHVTMAVASRVSLSDFGFLCSFSMCLRVSSSPLKF
uniref:Uncharacterized protein n=1 Tax=Xiphophorus couchianus TaxID=32473 RepID=A0A3B5KZ61_9TELE